MFTDTVTLEQMNEIVAKRFDSMQRNMRVARRLGKYEAALELERILYMLGVEAIWDSENDRYELTSLSADALESVKGLFSIEDNLKG